MSLLNRHAAMNLIGILNVVLGYYLFFANFTSVIRLYKLDRSNHGKLSLNDKDILKYIPSCIALIVMWVCVSCSGFFAFLASLAGGDKWAIGLAKVAKFFSNVVYWQILLILFYNWDWEPLRSKNQFAREWGSVGVDNATYLWYGVAQFYFVGIFKKVIKSFNLKVVEEERQIAKEKEVLLEKWRNVELDMIVTSK